MEFNFYQITAGFPALMENEEMTQEEKEKLEEELDVLLQEKSNNVIGYVRNIELTIQAIKTEEERNKSNRQTLENRLARFKEYLKECMKRSGITKIETPIGVIQIAKSPATVEVIDQEQVPDEFLRVKTSIEVDKTAIKKNFKETGEVPDGIRINTNNTSLRIK